MLRHVVATLAACGLLGIGSVQAAEPTLRSVRISFHTTGDEKDHDSLITAYVKIGDLELGARHDFGNIQFKEDSTHSFLLEEIADDITWAEAQGKKITTLITVTPSGRDKWKFQYTLKLKFSNGKTIVKDHKEEIELSRATGKHFGAWDD